jgi:uncharacterized protein
LITDCHSHFWTPEHANGAWAEQTRRISRSNDSGNRSHVTPESYAAGMGGADRSIVFGLQAPASGIHVSNDDVARFVSTAGSGVVGFASVDPREDDAVEELERAVQDLGLRGLKLGPTYQGTSPLDPRTMRVFGRASALGLPVLIHQGAVFVTSGRLADANPLQLDDVALAFPELRLIIAHMGHPWVHETAVVMRRHANVYADIAAMVKRPNMLARALTAAKEYGVLEKVLFGTDFPFSSVDDTATGLRRVVGHMQDRLLDPVSLDDAEALINRPTFELLGIDTPGRRPTLEGRGVGELDGASRVGQMS